MADVDGGGDSVDAASIISELQLLFFGSIEAEIWRPLTWRGEDDEDEDEGEEEVGGVGSRVGCNPNFKWILLLYLFPHW